MKTTRLTVTEKEIARQEGDLLIFCAIEQKEKAPVCHDLVKKQVETAFALGDFSGKDGETLMVYSGQDGTGPDVSARRTLVVGLGSLVKDPEPDFLREMLRKAGGAMSAASEKVKAKTVLVSLPALDQPDTAQITECLTEGILLGDYRFTKYKKPKKETADYPGIEQVIFAEPVSPSMARKGMKTGMTAAMAACEARDMANEPGNGWTAAHFADYASRLAETFGFTCRILEKKEMETLGMGGIIAVNQGSEEPPRLVILEYSPLKKKGTLLLVGKGVTFDSGGISLKQAQGMGDMKYDMSGGAAVLAAMQAVGREKPNVGVVAVIPATDNMGGGGAVKPGDVIRHYNGTTSEILNTDAEGRMILADALAYGIETYQPDCVVDIATLTGAVIIGLGHHYSGLFSNSDVLSQRLEEAGKRAGEPLWRLPLGKEYTKQIESTVADIKNMGGKDGGAITAAAYLEHFVGETPWAHIDIAGTAWDFTQKPYIPKGPTGTGVRTFLELIRHWKKADLKQSKS